MQTPQLKEKKKSVFINIVTKEAVQTAWHIIQNPINILNYKFKIIS